MPDDEELLDDEDLEDEDLEDDEEGEEEDSDEDSPKPVDLAALMARLDEQEKIQRSLTQAVSRFQSLQAKNEATARVDPAQVQAQEDAMDEVYDLLNLLAEGADDALIDPAVKEKAKQTLAKRNAKKADRVVEARVREMVEKAVGPRSNPENASNADPEQLASAVDRLEAELVSEIQSYGLDPDDFDWKEASAILGKSGPDGLRKHIRTLIRAAIADESRAARRQSRKASVGNRPKGGAPGVSGEAVMSGSDEKAKREFLRSLGIAGV